VRARLRRIDRAVGQDLERLRLDAAATKAAVAASAAVDRSFYGKIERGDAHPSLETLVALATALGADVSVRLYAGSGPRLTDRHQARMLEAILTRLHPVWRSHLEVPVWRPARGVVDAVFERLDEPHLVIGEAMSAVARLEQQLRWAAEKADSIGSSSLVGEGPPSATSRLLILRSTASTRDLATRFERTFQTAYPARSAEAVASLVDGAPWPGDAMIWVRIAGDKVEVLDRPPRGVTLGR
jgi:DNA-binding XRE family transcriptional regulator